MISAVLSTPWLLLVPLAVVIVLSLKGGLIYSIHGTKLAYSLGGYLFDRNIRLSSKLSRFLLNCAICYVVVALGLWIRWQIASP